MTGVQHLLIAPVILPLVSGALLALYDERRRFLKAVINLISTLTSLAIAVILLRFADTSAPGVYLLGDWPAPFAIVLVLDRLSALMLVLTALLACAALVFSFARWHRSGSYFHTLFQFLLMGVNGAFLTGDLFNLFVFFEVMLAASYGLVLYGSGSARVKAGLHYIAINLVASFLFLIGVGLIYGVTGTLNMADLAARIPGLAAEDRLPLEIGAAVLGVAFLVKAGMWPLSFWLPNAYSVSAAPAAAILAILTKVGVYILLRLSLLLFGDEAGPSSGFGSGLLIAGGMATIAFGMIGVLASQGLGRLASYSVLVSSGTVLAAVGLPHEGVIAAALFYLVSSTLALSALFLLIELVERGQDPAAHVLAVTAAAYGEEGEEEEDEVGIPIPVPVALLGVCFVGCGLLLAGLPPLSGFIAKAALVAGLFGASDAGAEGSVANWLYVALLILSGFSALIAMSRIGVRVFWVPTEAVVPRIYISEIVPVAFLLLLTLTLTIYGGTVMRYTEATAASLHSPEGYIGDVLAAPRVNDGTEEGQ